MRDSNSSTCKPHWKGSFINFGDGDPKLQSCLGKKQRRGEEDELSWQRKTAHFLSPAKHEMSLIEFSDCQLRMNKVAIQVLNTIIRKLIDWNRGNRGGGGRDSN
ncbi:hypothetical protein MUK42_17099 [Musa troglodytarum]|uniref:Uncharacterized protein n=1 Tax=Musa troglodytarum TaxID=320322 RepID=A0A9E7HTE8_9LILI|nr:hypothetical protein MUK42_17099 [Musa troglodytarum]